MPRVLVALALTALPTTALAVSEAWFHDGAAEVDLAGAVEVPLYRGDTTDALPSVLVEVPADEDAPPTRVFAVIDLMHRWSTVDEGTAKALGATKIKSTKLRGSTIKTAVIPELHIGELVLHDVRVEVDKRASHLTLGIATLDELGVAILPSQGVVRFVSDADAPELVASVGTPMQVFWLDGPWFEVGKKIYPNGLTGAVDGSAFGVEGKVRIATCCESTEFSGVPEVEDTKVQQAVVYAWGAPAVAELTLPDTWMVRNESLVDPVGETVALLGYDVLYGVDLAFDSGGSALAMADAADVKWTGMRDLEVEIARADYEAATKEEEGEEAEVAEADPAEEEAAGGPDKGDAAVMGAETPFATALWVAGLEDEALEHFKAAADAAGDNCGPYQDYGRHLLMAGQAEEAKAHLERAAELWDRWYAQDLDTREKVGKGKTAGIDFPLKQPTTCHEAWGDLALAHLATGGSEDVARLYSEKVDLDPNLPRAYGLSLVEQGKTDKANGPLRRAMNMRVLAEAEDHVALATAHAEDGKWVVFDRQVERVHAFGSAYVRYYMALGEAARNAGGDERATAVVDAMLERDPHSLQVQLYRAVDLYKRGRNPKARAELKALLPELREQVLAFEDERAGSPTAVEYRALFLGLSGAPAEGLALLDGLGRWTQFHHPVRSMLLRISGDDEGAEAALDEYARRNPALPTASLGLVTDLSGTGPRIKLQADKIELFENVLFVSGTADIIEESWPLLDEIKDLLLEHPEILKVEIGGHTDDQGNDRSNMKLSAGRAAAVVGYLTEHGVEAGRLVSKGFGETVPVADNTTPEGRQQNRRVEFTILEKK